MPLTWEQVVTVELYDSITGTWYDSGKTYESVEHAHSVNDSVSMLEDTRQKYRVVTTHYRSDDLR